MVYKHAVVSAFRIYSSVVKMLQKQEVGGSAVKSHGNYIADHGKSWKNHGIVFLNFCGNPEHMSWVKGVSCQLMSEKSPLTYNWRSIVRCLVLSYLDESSSFLQVKRTCIKAWMGLKFSKIEHGSMELAALECLKKSP